MGGVFIEYSGSGLGLFKLTKLVALYTLPLFLVMIYLGGIIMKTITKLGVAIALLITLAQPAWAGKSSGHPELLPAGLTFADSLTITGRNFNEIAPLNTDGTVNAIIEIPAGTNEKWEVDPKSGVLSWEVQGGKPRIVAYLGYPGNYGTVSRTVSGDKDPLDILVIGGPLLRGAVVPVNVIGALRLLDKGEQDDKLIAVLPDSHFDGVKTLAELDAKFPGVTAIIETWFLNYKGAGKMTSRGFIDAPQARQLLDAAIAAFK
jgi:inorganic pyrophosphatase